MKTSKYFLLLLTLFVFSCKKEKKSDNYFRGTVTLAADPSFASVADALAEAYTIAYPESKILVKKEKEDFAFLDLLHKKSDLCVMSRELSAAEKSEYKKLFNREVVPAKFAADAVVFVVPANSTQVEISYEEIQKEMTSGNQKFIFDDTNSSNLNFIAQKLNKKPKELKFFTLGSNESVIQNIEKYPGKIGVISLNSISREYSSKDSALRKKIKILNIVSQGRTYAPDSENLRTMQYPFTRVLYFLTNEAGFGMANGFIRYSCTQIGQMVVQKEGLQPYNLYKREVQFK